MAKIAMILNDFYSLVLKAYMFEAKLYGCFRNGFFHHVYKFERLSCVLHALSNLQTLAARTEQKEAYILKGVLFIPRMRTLS